MFIITIVLLAVASYASFLDVSGELERQQKRRAQVHRLFSSETPSGNKQSFDSRTVAIVLNLANRVHGKSVISELTLPARQRLLSASDQALRFEFLSAWAQFREKLESESEPFLVPDIELIAPLREWETYARSYALRDDLQDYQPEGMGERLDKIKSSILEILVPIVESPYNGDAQAAYALVGEYVVSALRNTRFNGTVVARMLADVEIALRKRNAIQLPADLVEEINQVQGYIRIIEKDIIFWERANSL